MSFFGGKFEMELLLTLDEETAEFDEQFLPNVLGWPVPSWDRLAGLLTPFSSNKQQCWKRRKQGFMISRLT